MFRSHSVHARFPSTRWSAVFAANVEQSTADQKQALEDLCKAYYQPLYGYARRRGSSPEDAMDLTQGFFAHLIETELFAKTDPENGKLRTYLLTCFRHYVSKENTRARAQKRGGDRQFIPLNGVALEERYGKSPRVNETPETLYERQWAMRLLEQALGRVGRTYHDSGRGELFDVLRSTLTGAAAESDYRTVAARLKINEGAVRTAIHRLRGRFRDALREAVADTVLDPGDVDQELRYLKSVLATPSPRA